MVWIEREIALLEEAGTTEVAVFHTGQWLLELTAREFFDQIIVGQLGVNGMIEGPNFAFGRDRKGDVATLSQWCAEAGIAFEVVAPTLVEGRLVSSSLIRQSLREGRVEEASQLLGRPHRIRGRVSRGAGRGRGLGFPTINLSEIDVLVPAEGVYAARAWVEGQGPSWPAACNIGPNPTFGDQTRKVEAHLIGFDGELYEKTVGIDFVRRLRATRPFASVEELLAQIRADVEKTRGIWAGSESGREPGP